MARRDETPNGIIQRGRAGRDLWYGTDRVLRDQSGAELGGLVSVASAQAVENGIIAQAVSSSALPTDLVGNAFAATLGAGTMLRNNGSKWKTINGIDVRAAMDAAGPATTAAAETIVGQLIVQPPFAVGDRLWPFFTFEKTGGTAETVTVFLRYGPLGTLADPHILITPGSPDTNGSATALGTTSLTFANQLMFRIESANSLQRVGTPAFGSAFGGNSTVRMPSAVTGLSDLLSATNVLTVSVSKSASVESVRLVDAMLFHISSPNG